jgi:hypothetical protein
LQSRISKWLRSTFELGAGYGFRPGSDRFVLKAILGYAFPVPGKNNDASATAPMKMGTSAHSMFNSFPDALVIK